MYELDFIQVGDKQNAEAIAVRFTEPPTGALRHVLIDGGWLGDAATVVAHMQRYYGGQLDLVVSTHPDGDHIGGLGEVLRECVVGELWVHRPVLYGAPNEAGFAAAEELAKLAESLGIPVREPFAGMTAFNGALLVAGPSPSYYLECLADQTDAELTPVRKALAAAEQLLESAAAWQSRRLPGLPIEIPFSDLGGVNGRNNSSVVLSLDTGSRRFLLTGDAGVPALTAAQDVIDASEHSLRPLQVFKLPHHGARRNLDSALIERLLGPATSERRAAAAVSVAPQSDGTVYPSGRISNACLRRGFPVFENRETTTTFYGDGAVARPGSVSLSPLPPLSEEAE